MLNHIYDGSLTVPGPNTELLGQLSLFNQTQYFLDGSTYTYSMNETGYVYVPSRCTEGSTVSCMLHVVFHGCSQYRCVFVIALSISIRLFMDQVLESMRYFSSGMIDEIYVTKTGYLQVAEANDIIMVFPQAIAISEGQVNPGGCWDTWGFAEPDVTSNFGSFKKMY
jgi:hypothetical protein